MFFVNFKTAETFYTYLCLMQITATGIISFFFHYKNLLFNKYWPFTVFNRSNKNLDKKMIDPIRIKGLKVYNVKLK